MKIERALFYLCDTIQKTREPFKSEVPFIMAFGAYRKNIPPQ